MKKISFGVIAAVLLCFVLAGCSQEKDIAGSERIEALRKEAQSWESGRYFITNVDTDVLEQVFSFYYDSDDRQVYLCEGVQNGRYYSEYSNGLELFREENGVGALIPSDNETYAVYTKKEPHPYSTGQLFFYLKDYIASWEEKPDGEGNMCYIYTYDHERLSKVLGNTVESFVTSYAFDENGDFVYFRQHNSSDITGNENSGVMDFTYEITVEDVNAVTEIENPVIIGGSAVE